MWFASLMADREMHPKMKFSTRDGVQWSSVLWWPGGTQCGWGGIYFYGSKP